MVMASASQQQQRYRHELGSQLRILRAERTRKHILARFPCEARVSLGTYSSWEVGTRNIPLTKLALLAKALGTTPHDVLADVDRVLCAVEAPPVMVVDLTVLALVSEPEVTYVSRWARAGIRGGWRVARLTPGDVTNLAELGGVPVEMLTETLAASAITAA